MATHSSVLAWRIPWAEEPDWLQSMGSQSVGHEATYTHTHTHTHTQEYIEVQGSIFSPLKENQTSKSNLPV